MPSRVRLLALDVDGTLLSPGGVLEPATAQAVAAARAAGVTVLLATGRMYRSVLPYARALGLGNVPLITLNGAAIRWAETGEVFAEAGVDPETARGVVRLCHEAGLHVQAYIGDALLVRERNWEAVEYARAVGVEAREIGDALFSLDRPSLKLLAIGPPEALPAMRQRIAERFPREVGLTTSQRNYLEIVPPHVSKGSALAAVAAHYGIAPAAVMAVGDAENDIPMLQFAGIGVAMGNADEAVQRSVQFVTDRVEEGGLPRAIAQHILAGGAGS